MALSKNQFREFAGSGIVAGVLLKGGGNYLEVDEHGVLAIPEGVTPTGFNLMVSVGEDSRTFVVQKEVGTEGGGYSSQALSNLNFGKGIRAVVMRDPIEVIRAGGSVWTGWHKNAGSNRVDCWHLGEDGKLDLFQVGVLTHDNGKSWKLHGEYRWRGHLYDHDSMLVGVPAHSKWGSLNGGTSNRIQIFNHPEFVSLLRGAEIPAWEWDELELSAAIEPPLPEVPDGDFAVVDWYISCAGQTGQGIVKSKNGSPAWVHGCDVEGFNPDSPEPLLWRGDIVSFKSINWNWGTKKNGPPKLTGVKLVERDR